VCREYEIEHEFVARGIAGLFAGGIGNSGSVCGAVIGATMAIGLKRGRAETMEGMLAELEVAREFRRRFEEEVGDIRCRELTGADLTTPEGLEAYMGSDAPMMVCFPAVVAAHRIVVELLGEDS
jgi:C_GCAxxG_C_C family probable redox protein